MNIVTAMEQETGVTWQEAVEAIRGAATNLAGPAPTAWSPSWVKKLENAAELLSLLADVARPLAVQYADHPDPAIRKLAEGFDAGALSATMTLGSLAILSGDEHTPTAGGTAAGGGEDGND